MLVSSLALDPIEKKPLAAFRPGSRILSVGSVGCNLSCPWCQNHEIAHPRMHIETQELSSEYLVQTALDLKEQGNIGIAFTYNEPLVHWKSVLECAILCKSSKLATVMVSNGYANEQIIYELEPYIDAWNIDLKAFSHDAYTSISGNLDAVKRSIEILSASSHVEVTTLIVPGFNDSVQVFEESAKWLSNIDPTIVWHLTRFFPNYNYTHVSPTPLSTLHEMKTIAQRYMKTVLLGNV